MTRSRGTRTLLMLGTAALVAAGATACKGSIQINADASPKTGTGSTTAPARSGSTGTKTTTGIPACQNRQVKVAFDPNGSQGAAGTQVQRFVITNHGTITCKLYGHPGIKPYGSTPGTPLGVTVGRIQAGFGTIGNAPSVVTVHPGGTAVFFLKSSDIPVGSATTCPKAQGLSFTVPPSTVWDTSLEVSLPGPLMLCGDSTQVSSIFPPSVTG